MRTPRPETTAKPQGTGAGKTGSPADRMAEKPRRMEELAAIYGLDLRALNEQVEETDLESQGERDAR